MKDVTRQVRLIAARDFWAIVQTKSFFIGLLALVFLASVMPAMILLSKVRREYKIAVFDPTGIYCQELIARFPGYTAGNPYPSTVTFEPVSSVSTADREAALNRVRAREYFAMIEVTPRPVSGDETYSLNSSSLADQILPAQLEGLMGEIARDRRAERMGISPERLKELLRPVDWQTRKVTATSSETTNPATLALEFLTPIALVAGLYGIISFQSERLLTALLEEKMKRLIEVLLTRANVYELLLGKMLGILYVGFLLYLGVGLLVGMVGYALGMMHLLTFKSLVFYTVLYISGYFLFASFYAMVGAACTNQKDAENLSMPLRMLLMMPIMIAAYVNMHPQSNGSLFFAYFPFTAPFVMANRMLVVDPAWWELVGSAGSVLIAGSIGLWAAARIFETSLAVSGRSLSMADIAQSLFARRLTPLQERRG